mmetsp:Transcript_47107/g.131061  ORF Transcript_47107/g.131061 Transcript_47107/m.131061 type:complete len:265 (+) Transcript_47107:284-1078(+)
MEIRRGALPSRPQNRPERLAHPGHVRGAAVPGGPDRGGTALHRACAKGHPARHPQGHPGGRQEQYFPAGSRRRLLSVRRGVEPGPGARLGAASEQRRNMRAAPVVRPARPQGPVPRGSRDESEAGEGGGQDRAAPRDHREEPRQVLRVERERRDLLRQYDVVGEPGRAEPPKGTCGEVRACNRPAWPHSRWSRPGERKPARVGQLPRPGGRCYRGRSWGGLCGTSPRFRVMLGAPGLARFALGTSGSSSRVRCNCAAVKPLAEP